MNYAGTIQSQVQLNTKVVREDVWKWYVSMVRTDISGEDPLFTL